LLLIQLLRAAGAESVLAADPLPHRREAAAKSGADRVADPGPLVSHRMPLDEVSSAFSAAARRTGLKVIVEPGR
jgi:L-iditol 2-dehydrogenase